jgi:hypothetical protein
MSFILGLDSGVIPAGENEKKSVYADRRTKQIM